MTRFHYASTRDPDMLYLVQYRITDPFFFLETTGKQYIFLGSTDIQAFKEESKGKVEAVNVGPLRDAAAQITGLSARDAQADDKLGNLAKLILEKYEVNEEVSIPTTFHVSIPESVRSRVLR